MILVPSVEDLPERALIGLAQDLGMHTARDIDTLRRRVLREASG